ncbi:hypothetical protein bcCo53_001234 (plasmid) [Borrelia coriaceae]|nr:hypothetical protein [Borrelia coriaceae]UPA17065.1 hypothetical protein bcCo53_001234 [Borrelia coriaceae]
MMRVQYLTLLTLLILLESLLFLLISCNLEVAKKLKDKPNIMQEVVGIKPDSIKVQIDKLLEQFA